MSEQKHPPRVENAPGLKWRARKDGWMAFWQARTDIVKRGFRPATAPLWWGIEPSEVDTAYISDQCQRLQDEMLVWSRGGLPQVGPYNATIRSLAHCYQTDPDSTYLQNRYRTRLNYGILIRRIVRDHGDERLADLTGREIGRWHKAWEKSGVPMAHSLIRMLRGILSFGVTLLECEHCIRLSAVMSKQRYKMGKPRVEALTAEMVNAVRAEAHRQGHPMIALAQAFQFECMFRQKDLIGEYVPQTEPGLSDITVDDEKWLWGIRWSEIDENLRLKHITSKREKLATKDLKLMPMVLEELPAGLVVVDPITKAVTVNRSLVPATGAVIVEPRTGKPYRGDNFRIIWRKIARAAGIPDRIRNQDSRAGAITEALMSGARMQSVRKAATHSTEEMTQKYSRRDDEEDAEVAQFRAASRKNKSGT